MFTSTSCVTEHSVHCRVHRGLLYINLVLSIKTYQSINVINIIEHLLLHDSTLKMILALDYIYWHISTEKCSMIVTLISNLHDGWMLVGSWLKWIFREDGLSTIWYSWHEPVRISASIQILHSLWKSIVLAMSLCCPVLHWPVTTDTLQWY